MKLAEDMRVDAQSIGMLKDKETESFKYPRTLEERVCPRCRGGMVMLSRKFAAPRSMGKDSILDRPWFSILSGL
ncbi:hypothetical protein [Janthinobacterium sp. HH01]|uniref:hypothetical protein n=1 Tax=Janthinobacterium sp. HH01 TaxID=1198452 RepID=UPI001268AAAB|nr:hypothetical protein [Janthinobacterium sp. HH01]